jgi:hypothetical protein
VDREPIVRKPVDRLLPLILPLILLLPAARLRAEDPPTREEVEDLEKRLEKVEKKAALDRIRFSGDYRFEAHSIDATIPEHFDGMRLQNLVVNTMFYYGATGAFPQDPAAVDAFIGQNYAQYLRFTGHLTFEDLRAAMAAFPPQMQAQLYGMLLPATHVAEGDADNSILYTNRLRLRMEADVAPNVDFGGRLSMYKTWGDSTGVQVFDGQPTSISIDGTTTHVPNSDVLRVDRAYFTWKDIGGLPAYLSIGRRPSTEGAPLHLRQDEPRGGTPMGSIINFQFDGITAGWHLGEHSTLRACYGLGYEAGFGNGEVLESSADRLSDAHFLGVNWDIWNDDRTFVQTTVARAFDVTDGFNGLVVLPNNPVTGESIGAPVVLRYSPSANLGDIDLASLVAVRRDGPLDWFVSANWMRSRPDDVTTPFGGLFSDPFETPEERTGSMFYAGLRLNLNEDRTKIGAEWNRGSKYWFNFAAAEDDILAPKTAARGNVYELYVTHRVADWFVLRFDALRYDYEYSGSGWHLGAPKALDSSPILGFPTYESANVYTLSMDARF